MSWNGYDTKVFLYEDFKIRIVRFLFHLDLGCTTSRIRCGCQWGGHVGWKERNSRWVIKIIYIKIWLTLDWENRINIGMVWLKFNQWQGKFLSERRIQVNPSPSLLPAVRSEPRVRDWVLCVTFNSPSRKSFLGFCRVYYPWRNYLSPTSSKRRPIEMLANEQSSGRFKLVWWVASVTTWRKF